MKTQENLAHEGIGFLPVFNGYTVDVRLKQFRKVNKDTSIEFIDFDSEKGKRLLAESESNKENEVEQDKLTQEDFSYINAVMCNDEVSTDEELFNWFEKELNISKELAITIVSFRDTALREIFFDIQDYL